MRINDRFGRLSHKLYENMGKIGAALTYAGAVGTAVAGIYYTSKIEDIVNRYIPKRISGPIMHQAADVLSWPLAAIGLGYGTSAVNELRALGRNANSLDYTSAVLRTFPVASPLIAKLSDGDLVYTVAVPLLAIVVGSGLRYINRNRFG